MVRDRVYKDAKEADYKFKNAPEITNKVQDVINLALVIHFLFEMGQIDLVESVLVPWNATEPRQSIHQVAPDVEETAFSRCKWVHNIPVIGFIFVLLQVNPVEGLFVKI